MDYITIHLLPYWEGLAVDDALRFSMDKLDAVQAAYPGKHVVIGESRLAVQRRGHRAARASRVNQALFLRKFFNIGTAPGLDYFVMEAFDQPWKTSFEGRAAGYWGMSDLDRQAKWSMTGPWWRRRTGPLGRAAACSARHCGRLLLSRRPDIRLTGKVLVAGLTQAFGATLACVLLAMAGKYLSRFAATRVGRAGRRPGAVAVAAAGGQLRTGGDGVRPCARRAPVDLLPGGVARLPKVSIHLPICNEPPQMVRQTLDALAKLDYPDFEVLVIDNNTTDPAVWEPVAEHCARLGARFRFFHLGRWPGFKAGALNFALGQTAADAEIVGVLDSDYIVDRGLAALHGAAFRQSASGLRAVAAGLPRQRRQLLQAADVLGVRRLLPARHGHPQRAQRHHPARHHDADPQTCAGGADGWAEWTICEDAELGLSLFRAGWEAIYSDAASGAG